MLSKIGRVLNWLEESLLALLLAAMTLVTFSQVVARYVFNSGAVWALELTVFIFAWLVLIGASFGIRVHAHIGVDILVRLLPVPMQKLCGGFSILAGLVYAGILFKGGWDTVSLLHLIQIEAEDLPIPRWIPTLAVPIGFALIFLRLLQAAWSLIRGRSSGLLLADEVEETLEQLQHGETAR